MALFHPIITTADLPPIGTGRESGTFDFKGTVNRADKREMAKDVAAFANALGGVILVGVYEAKGTLSRYAPMNRDDAEATKVAYEQAIAGFCHPQPLVDAVRIETMPSTPPPQYVVAVNVYATPLGPVGVRWEHDAKGQSFAFPLRTTAQTHFMSPTELAMLMVPAIRRIATLLDQIPIDQRKRIKLYFTQPAPESKMATLRSVDPLSSTVTFDIAIPGGWDETWRLDLPIDSIRSVWRSEDTTWMVAIGGGMLISRDFIPK